VDSYYFLRPNSKIKLDVITANIISNFEVLFDIFDFNELGSLATIDIEFMISSCINSTFKILSKNKEADLDEIQKLVEDGFSKEQRIDITEFIKWAKNNEECLTLFELLSGAEQEKKKGK